MGGAAPARGGFEPRRQRTAAPDHRPGRPASAGLHRPAGLRHEADHRIGRRRRPQRRLEPLHGRVAARAAALAPLDEKHRGRDRGRRDRGRRRRSKPLEDATPAGIELGGPRRSLGAAHRLLVARGRAAPCRARPRRAVSREAPVSRAIPLTPLPCFAKTRISLARSTPIIQTPPPRREHRNGVGPAPPRRPGQLRSTRYRAAQRTRQPNTRPSQAAVASIVLGMGMPTVGVYVLLAALVVPSITALGVEPLPAHLFVLHFGMMSMITPPVAIAAFAAGNLAGAPPMRTALEAVRLGWAAYAIPFAIVASSGLLLIGPPRRSRASRWGRVGASRSGPWAWPCSRPGIRAAPEGSPGPSPWRSPQQGWRPRPGTVAFGRRGRRPASERSGTGDRAPAQNACTCIWASPSLGSVRTRSARGRAPRSVGALLDPS